MLCYVMCYVSDFLDRGESGRSNWVKVDGPKGHKVDGLRKLTVQNTKVDGPQRMTLGGTQNCVGGQNGMKVDGPKNGK